AALEVYRRNFKPSARLSRPYAMVGVNVIAAETDTEAVRLFTSLQQHLLSLLRRTPSQLPPPVESMDELWTPVERAHIAHMTRYSAVGAPATVRATLENLIAETHADELIITAQIHDHAARVHSLELTAGLAPLAHRSGD